MDGTKETEGEEETRKQQEAERGKTTGAWPMPALPQFPRPDPSVPPAFPENLSPV